MTLLICPVRPGDQNEELRYALRSWETNLILPDGLELWTVGYKPSWLAPDRHLDGNRYKSLVLAVFDNIWLASEYAYHDRPGANPALYMNDDFFCLDPVGAVLPTRRNMSLAQQVAQAPPNVGTWWPRSLALTLEWLQRQGFPDPPSYEGHRPLSASPGGMYEALSRYRKDSGWDNGDIPDSVPQWRTIYGVLNEVHAYPVADAKLGLRTPGVGTPWVSTSDQTWRRYALDMMKRFQKPSRWEIEV